MDMKQRVSIRRHSAPVKRRNGRGDSVVRIEFVEGYGSSGFLVADLRPFSVVIAEQIVG